MSSDGDSTTGKCFQGQCLNVLSLLSAVGTKTIIADRRRDCVDNPMKMTNDPPPEGKEPPSPKSPTLKRVRKELRPFSGSGKTAESTATRRRPCGKECHHGDGPCVRRVRPVSLVKAKKPVDKKERRQQMSTFQKIHSGTSKHVHRCAKHLRCNCKIAHKKPRRRGVNYKRVSVVDPVSGETRIAPREPQAMRNFKGKAKASTAVKPVISKSRFDVLASLDSKFEVPTTLKPPAVVANATAVRALKAKAQRHIDRIVGNRQVVEVTKVVTSDSEWETDTSPTMTKKESEASSKASTDLIPYVPAPKPESHARFVEYCAARNVKEEELDWPTRKLWLDEFQLHELQIRDNEKEKQRREFSLELESFKAALRGISVRVNRARLLPGTLALANGTKIKASAINQNSSVSGSCTKTMKKSFQTVSKGTSLSTSAAGGGGFFVYVSAGVSKGSSNNKSAQSGCQVIDNDDYDLLCRSGVLVEQEYTVSSWDDHTVLLGDSHMVTFSAGQALWLATNSQQIVCLHGELFFIEKPELLTVANSTSNLAKGISSDSSLKLPPIKDLLTVAVSPIGDLKVAAKTLMGSKNLSKESKAYYEALKKERAAEDARSTIDLDFQKFAFALGNFFQRIKPSKGGESWPDWTLRNARAGNFKKLENKLDSIFKVEQARIEGITHLQKISGEAFDRADKAETEVRALRHDLALAQKKLKAYDDSYASRDHYNYGNLPPGDRW